MDEEQAVLNFFAQSENLPLALSVADQTDDLRRQSNNGFWLALRERIASGTPAWHVTTTEDRNATECLVGLHLEPAQDQTLYLRPMLEQQYLGDALRIYYGLMWSALPSADQMRLDAVTMLRDSLVAEGFKSNENFLAWQWTPYYPRRRDFLLRFATAAQVLVDEIDSLMQYLLVTHSAALQGANSALRSAPRSAAVSLDNLRANLKSKLV